MHKEIQYSRYLPRQLFDLVLDIEKYPEFLPWCSDARILKSESNIILCELGIRFQTFHTKYTSKIEYHIPNDINEEYVIKVEMIEGPFKYLNNFWRFKFDQQKIRTKIDFEIDFCFNSTMLQKLMRLLFKRALVAMIAVFKKRAELVYGDN